jgi:hypothetical protein
LIDEQEPQQYLYTLYVASSPPYTGLPFASFVCPFDLTVRRITTQQTLVSTVSDISSIFIAFLGWTDHTFDQSADGIFFWQPDISRHDGIAAELLGAFKFAQGTKLNFFSLAGGNVEGIQLVFS